MTGNPYAMPAEFYDRVVELTIRDRPQARNPVFGCFCNGSLVRYVRDGASLPRPSYMLPGEHAFALRELLDRMVARHGPCHWQDQNDCCRAGCCQGAVAS